MLRFISWNVNGLRAIVGKNFHEVFTELDADFFCLQEIKLKAGQIELDLPGYEQYWNYAERPGYSGTAVFTKHTPELVTYGIDNADHDDEGRVINLRYSNFWLVNVYTPNSQDELRRLDYRMEWEDCFRRHLLELAADRPVILCGDLNVAHKEIELKNPSSNRRNAGFTDEERGKMTELLEAGFTDTFRHFYPDKTDIYTWWSYRFRARDRNAGWRIDYFIVSDDLVPKLESAAIHDHIMGSDHCPVELVIPSPFGD